MLEILGRANSVNVRKVTWCAAELGVPFNRSDWGRGFRPTSEPEFLALNPNAVVPTIKDGDVVLYESHTIVRYLCAKHAPQMLGADPVTLGLRSQWMDWTLSTLSPQMATVFQGKFIAPDKFTPEAIAASEAKAKQLFGLVETALADGSAPFGGEELTAADFVIAPFVARFLTTIAPAFGTPAMDAWTARLKERPAFVEHVATPAP